MKRLPVKNRTQPRKALRVSTHLASKALRVAALLLTGAAGLCAAAQQPLPVYDISTVKPHAPGDGDMRIAWLPTTYDASNVSLLQLLASAYNIRDWLIFGLPPWADKARYDISAKISEGDPVAIKALPQEQRRAMVAALLGNRFHLVVHNESKVQPVYELSTLPEGTKLTANLPPPGAPMQRPGSRWSVHNGQLTATAMSMQALCDNLSYQVERSIVDRTGLTGTYDLALTWTPAGKLASPGDNGLPADAPPDIFTALKQQLGLKLTAARAPVPTLVVDSISPPEPD